MVGESKVDLATHFDICQTPKKVLDACCLLPQE